MAHGEPAVDVLLGAVREHLQRIVQPRLEDAEAYQNRVAINLLKILEREQALRPAQRAEERSSLEALLRMRGELEPLNVELCRRIRSGELAIDDAALLAHLDRVARDSLAIDNPGYSAYRRAAAES